MIIKTIFFREVIKLAKKKTAQISKKEIDEGKLQAALSYLMITGLITMITEKKNKYARLHAKQGMALLLIFLILRALILGVWWLFPINFWVTNLGIILIAYMAVMAAQGKAVKLPVIYELGEWLTKIFKL
jgi:uncharacterized membrane protein